MRIAVPTREQGDTTPNGESAGQVKVPRHARRCSMAGAGEWGQPNEAVPRRTGEGDNIIVHCRYERVI